jgi:acyl-CoA thioester hydrolase
MVEALKQCKSIIELPIQWGDMDAAQHVNNIMYLRYGESARIDYMKSVGMHFDLTGKGVILAEIHVQYKFPLTFPDTIQVGTRTLLDSIEDFSFLTEQIIYSTKYQRVAAVIQAKLVSYDFKALKKSPLSDVDKQAIIAFETL